jgi:hypothetical protein
MKFQIIYISVLLLALCSGSIWSAVEEPAKSDNLLKYTLTDSGDGKTPQGYTVNTAEGGKEASVSFDNSVYIGKKGPSLKVDIAKTGSVFFDYSSFLPLEKGKKYLLTVSIKIKDLHLDGVEANNIGMVRGVMVYVYSASGKHSWEAISGNGSTKGWVTMLLPFDTAKVPELATSRVFFRCLNIAGTVWFQNPSVVELPEGSDVQAQFIQEDGTVLPGGLLKLTGK